MPRHTRQIAAQLLGQAALGRAPGSGPRFVVVAGPDAGRALPIAEGDTVGRGGCAEVPLSDPAASRQHLRIERRGGELAILDLGSKNGVELNGRRVRVRSALRDGDRVRVGATVLEATGVSVPGARDPEAISTAGRRAASSGCPRGQITRSGSPEAAGAQDPVRGSTRLVRAGAAMLLAAGVALAAAGS